MFQKDDVHGHEMDTIIGSSIKIEGNFIGQGNIIVEGEVKGNLKTSQNVEAGEGSKVIADIEATNALISGEVHGSLKISERLELTNTAKIIGDIEASVLVVASGASIDGHCQISSNGKNIDMSEPMEEEEDDEEDEDEE